MLPDPADEALSVTDGPGLWVPPGSRREIILPGGDPDSEAVLLAGACEVPSLDKLDGVYLRALESVAQGSLEHFNRLSPESREYFRAVLVPNILGSDRATIEALERSDYEILPPTPEEFLSNPDYLPAEMASELFPAWRPVVVRACTPGARVFELNITGASSIGKTTAAMIVLDYKMIRTFCLRDPAAFFGLQARSMIYFGLYSPTKKLIKEVGFHVLRDMLIDPSPFWRDLYPRLKQGQEYIRWPSKRVEVITGSSELHALGRALLAVAADELNYFEQGEKTASRAPELVSEVSRRLEGRFIDKGGDIPGIAIYISQTRTTSDYLERRIREKRDQDGVMCVRGPRWAFNTKGYYHKDGFHPGEDPVFRVYTGSDTTDPRILDRVAKRTDGSWRIEPADTNEEVPDGGRVIEVPAQHYRAFYDDIHGALRNIADVPSGSFTPFFSRREVILDAFTDDPDIVFPFSSQVIPCYEKGAAQLQDAFDIERVTTIHLGRRQPLRHPEAPRYLHLDLSQGGDRTGMAMVHPSGHYREDRSVEEDPAQVGAGEIVKTVEVDFYVGLVGGPFGEPIDFRKVRVFIDWLRRCGYWIRGVTADQYMSFDMLQRLRELGFVTDRLSVDRTAAPYRDLRGCLNEARIAIPLPTGLLDARTARLLGALQPGTRRRIPEEVLRRVVVYVEMIGLEHDVEHDKVDHRATNPDGSKGSKDVADGLAGATHRCLSDKTTPADGPAANVSGARSRLAVSLNRYLSKV